MAGKFAMARGRTRKVSGGKIRVSCSDDDFRGVTLSFARWSGRIPMFFYSVICLLQSKRSLPGAITRRMCLNWSARDKVFEAVQVSTLNVGYDA